ncbi:c-type cytochrome [Sulfurovum sp. NBC37-1]|uniref:c-type cytochrome n=1 Tax=Sulfurovum sp. (strain NBC37-1) TaxID=387093 RepID=UPI0001587537|nr:c-type cytochrome [Sulfurovum sp. NBC37-1]BAF71170.1 ubiquinol cytochrome c oxidoreductase, cytochrome c1 subunit [Sulfurovum sp. NBC37-1]
MKELKIFGIVAVFTLILYWGVEPFAHSQMHKHVEGDNLQYSDLKPVAAKGDAAKGEALAAACVGCHSIKVKNMPAPMDAVASAQAYGVNPPDLSLAGAMLDEKFFAHFLLNPAEVTKSKHFAMPPSAGSEQDAADIVAYFKSIAPKEATAKEGYEFACGRCHANRYDKWTQIGDVPKTKSNIKTGVDLAALDFKKNLGVYQNKLADYMGKLPPDLSIIIRARSEHFLHTFIEDPQSQLPGTAMPRVGLNKEGMEKVFTYLEETGDPSAPKRKAVGPWVLAFFFIFTFLAYGWKKAMWKGHH